MADVKKLSEIPLTELLAIYQYANERRKEFASFFEEVRSFGMIVNDHEGAFFDGFTGSVKIEIDSRLKKIDILQ